MSSSKNQLRETALAVRADLEKQQGIAAAEMATRFAMMLLRPLPRTRIVAVYHPIGSELDSRFLLTELARSGFRTALPVVVAENQPLAFKLWTVGDNLHPGLHGTQVPDDDAPFVEPDLIFVPLLAFDAQGYRLGYGGGYFDRTLQAFPDAQAFGLAFSGQMIDPLPVEPHDMPLMGVLTETGMVIPKNGKD